MLATGCRREADWGYTGPMKTVEWRTEESPQSQLDTLCGLATRPGVLHARFVASGEIRDLAWKALEPWTRSRAVTVAEVGSDLASPGLDVALCSDLVYLHPGVRLLFGQGEPTAGLLWALGRAGRAALARGLLDSAPVAGDEAVRLGLAQRVLQDGELPLVPRDASLVALTTARDLMRSSTGARSDLELAAFKLLFSSGDPGEGARAFLERRAPEFTD